MAKETVCAVVVTYNRKELLGECLDGLLAQTRPLDAIYLIDNASTDGTPEMLKEKGYLNKVSYFRMTENTGGSGGFHEGIKRAYEKGFDWLWVMDDDVAPSENSLETLLEYREKSGVLIPVEVLRDTRDLIDTTAVTYDLTNPFKKNPKRSVSETYHSLDELPEILEVCDFTFEGPLISREVVRDNGFPREDFFISGDDTEYALRIRAKGGRLLLIKGAMLFKRKAPGKFSHIPWKDYYYKRNLFWTHKTYGKNVFVKYCKPALYFLAVSLIKGLLMGNLLKIKVAYYAIKDAFSDNFIRRFNPENTEQRDRQSGNIFLRRECRVAVIAAVLTALLIIKMPALAVISILFAMALLFFGKNIDTLFFFILFLVPIDRFYFPLFYKLKAYQIMLLFAVLLELASVAIYKSKLRINWNILDTAVLTIYLCKVLSIFVSINHDVYIKSILLNGFFVMLYYYVRLKSESIGAERAIRFMIYTSTAFIFFGFLEFLLWRAGIGSPEIAKEIYVYAGRPCSVFKEPDWFGGYLVFIIGMAMPFVDSRLSRDRAGVLYRPIFYIALIMSLLIVVRSAWLGLCACLPFLLISQKMSLKTVAVIIMKTAILILLLLVALFFVGPSFYDSIRDRFYSIFSFFGRGQYDSAAFTRIHSYDVIWNYIKANPFKGYGTGAWEFLSRQHAYVNPALSTNNIVLTPIFEMGIAGVVAYLLFMIALVKMIRDGFRHSNTIIENQYAVGIAISVVGAFVVAIFNDITLTGFYWAFIAMFNSYVLGLKKDIHENRI